MDEILTLIGALNYTSTLSFRWKAEQKKNIRLLKLYKRCELSTCIWLICLRFIKLSLVGMQLPAKYKENFDVSSEGPSSGYSRHALLQTKGLRSKRRNSPHIFQVVASLPTKACSFDWHYLHWQRQFKIISYQDEEVNQLFLLTHVEDMLFCCCIDLV
jgi:hypothetical protein